MSFYGFSQNKVGKKADIPEGPHFQALVFGTRDEVVGSYGPPDPPGDTHYTVPNVDVYVFKTQDELQSFITAAIGEKASFVFYQVQGLGKSKVQISLDV